jgi:hypothetical protein
VAARTVSSALIRHVVVAVVTKCTSEEPLPVRWRQK